MEREVTRQEFNIEQLDAIASVWAQRHAESLPPLSAHEVNLLWRSFSRRFDELVTTAESNGLGASFEAKDPDARPQLLREHGRMLHSNRHELEEDVTYWKELPGMRTDTDFARPRVLVLATMYLDATGDMWDRKSWKHFVEAAEVREALLAKEIWQFGSILKFALMEQMTIHAEVDTDTHLQNAAGSPLSRMRSCLLSMERLGQLDWSKYLSQLIPFDSILHRDPAGIYGKMDLTGRGLYQQAVAQIAWRSNMTEVEVAECAIDLARHNIDQRSGDQRSIHVGYYLIGEGRSQLLRETGHNPSLGERIRDFGRRHADELYIGGILILTFALLVAILMPHISWNTSMTGLLVGLFLMMMPASQTATDILNIFVQRMYPAKPLPKMDFSKTVPEEYATLVAIPTLLISEKQVERLVEELEVRYLANRDANIHFALLTDLPDSIAKPEDETGHRLVATAVRLIEGLNSRYGSDRRGTFLLLHRRRAFNVRQGVWMGWERKRGKLLDLNKLLLGKFDAFPVKSTILNDLRHFRYVITLDSDTQLPRGAAHRMIGAMAHPLNRAVIDPKRRIVTQGYGILQPRVNISVHSANQSRLAWLQSGDVGIDPYSRATSDVYQDLYGEAIFTGKGIYDIATLYEVLDKRFPRDALLSHDLIEGAYARVGLLSDVDVIDDYPSHYSAWTRRRHRWLRGDWQIVQWLFSSVPNEDGNYVVNPISDTSRWKIFDNLRRSLLEVSTFALLLVGWFALPGERVYWTLCTLGVLFLPTVVQLLASLIHPIAHGKWAAVLRAFSNWFSSIIVVLMVLAFLPAQVLTSLDAIIRSAFRSFVSGEKLLEWETAAQAESNATQATTDRYIRFVPLLTLVIGALLFSQSRRSLWVIVPILVLWMLTRPIMQWLNGKPFRGQIELTESRVRFLRNVALRTWRYFKEFSSDANHWLVPDNVQEEDGRRAERASPTNIGMLLNARQAAVELGYLTVPEFAELTQRTLKTLEQMSKYRGHILNWYDTKSLAVMPPELVSTADSGNLCASLLSLSMGVTQLLRKPMVSEDLMTGIRDHQRVLSSLGATWSERMFPVAPDNGILQAVDDLVLLSATVQLKQAETDDTDIAWWTSQFQERIQAVQDYVRQMMPWLLPEFDSLRRTILKPLESEIGAVTFVTAPNLMARIDTELNLAQSRESAGGTTEPIERLCGLLSVARRQIDELTSLLENIAERALSMVLEMDFTHLLSPERDLLSIGYTPAAKALNSSCYDLLATEARVAVFIAIAKGDIPQQTWFRMGRSYVRAFGHSALISWTGTIFEYLMPTLWMQSYPNTMIRQSMTAVIDVQKAFVQRRDFPWGISESGYSQTDEQGNYLYHAFGIPDLALKFGAEAGPVFSPYSTCLALEFDPEAALRNLQRMQKRGWLGSYGFYEAIDYSTSAASRRTPTPVVVRSWMAHHQGMSLLAICNLLRGQVFQNFFHAAPIVRSTERLLHERPRQLLEEV